MSSLIEGLAVFISRNVLSKSELRYTACWRAKPHASALRDPHNCLQGPRINFGRITVPRYFSNPNLKAADTGILDSRQLCGFLARQGTTLGDIISGSTSGAWPCHFYLPSNQVRTPQFQGPQGPRVGGSGPIDLLKYNQVHGTPVFSWGQLSITASKRDLRDQLFFIKGQPGTF